MRNIIEVFKKKKLSRFVLTDDPHGFVTRSAKKKKNRQNTAFNAGKSHTLIEAWGFLRLWQVNTTYNILSGIISVK